jgi:hypothetical protein
LSGVQVATAQKDGQGNVLASVEALQEVRVEE